VCGKNIFKVKDRFTLEGHNFDIMQYNWIFKSLLEHSKMSYKLSWDIITNYMLTMAPLSFNTLNVHPCHVDLSQGWIKHFDSCILTLNFFKISKWRNFSAILVFEKFKVHTHFLPLKEVYPSNEIPLPYLSTQINNFVYLHPNQIENFEC
jgi:hypothetical protein